MRDAVWFDLGEGEGVLEFDECAGWAVELHMVVDSETGRTIAWWATDAGIWLAAASVGDA